MNKSIFVTGLCVLMLSNFGYAASIDFTYAGNEFVVDALTTYSGDVNGTSISATASYGSVMPVIINVKTTKDFTEQFNPNPYWNYSQFTNYTVDLTLTNQTDKDWTDFHLEVGYYMVDDLGSSLSPQFETMNGVDQPVEILDPLSDIFSSASVVPSSNSPDEGDTDNANIPNGDIGINWYNGVVNTGSSVKLSFALTIGDLATGTNFNMPNNDGSFMMAFSLTPTTDSNAPVPEPTTMLLFGTGIARLAAIGRRRRK